VLLSQFKKIYLIYVGYTQFIYPKDPTISIQMSRSLHISQARLRKKS